MAAEIQALALISYRIRVRPGELCALANYVQSIHPMFHLLPLFTCMCVPLKVRNLLRRTSRMLTVSGAEILAAPPLFEDAPPPPLFEPYLCP